MLWLVVVRVPLACLQAMINEGLIDPVNGLDDFRIVIGDGDGAK